MMKLLRMFFKKKQLKNLPYHYHNTFEKSKSLRPTMQDLWFSHVSFICKYQELSKYQELMFWKYVCGVIFSFYLARVHTMFISTIATFQ